MGSSTKSSSRNDGKDDRALERGAAERPFSEFMEDALYGHNGYYTVHASIGGRGADFYTASQLSLFPATLARYIVSVWRASGQPQQLQVVELGVGQGELAKGISSSLERLLPRDVNWTYILYDRSSRQRELANRTIGWETLNGHFGFGSPVQDVDTVVVANELLDALPVERLQRRKGGYHRAYVRIDPSGEHSFTWRVAPTELSVLADKYTPVPVDCKAEICTKYPNLFREVRSFAKRVTAVFVDYGITTEEWRSGVRPDGTLRGYQRHRLVDPLYIPGACDITADVHWDYATDCAIQAGFGKATLTAQGSFLMRHGIMEILQSCIEQPALSAREVQSLTNQLKQLVLPGGMGERFSVLECLP